ncbi:MAG: hypothetical protein ACP5O8_02910 [Candidatus Aenigmatarchaeota archaeon]
MRKLLLFSIFFFLIPTSQAISINSYRLTPKGIVYEGTSLVLSVNVTSETNVTKVYATLLNYTLDLKLTSFKNLNLSLKIGTEKDGLWFYTIQEKEGYYVLANITAVDMNGTSVTVEPFIDFLVIKNITNITIPSNMTFQNFTCNASFSLGKQEFNSTQTVNYSVRMTNLGDTLLWLNYSISSELQVFPKQLELTSLPPYGFVDIKFDFITPNLTEDKLYSFVLNVSSKGCNFTFPFNIKVKKFEQQQNQVKKPQGGIQFPTLPVGNIQFPEITIGNWKISSSLFPVFLLILIVAIVFVLMMIREFFKHEVKPRGVKKSG